MKTRAGDFKLLGLDFCCHKKVRCARIVVLLVIDEECHRMVPSEIVALWAQA
ncbi:MAG: hypothetical protein LBE09_01090 [Christensenellaceae bacterium]|nr:hypothetical protein [Christensenellaceae bacterium]